MTYAISIPQTGGPEVLTKQRFALPIPGDNELRVRNHATAVNFIDTIIRRGAMPEGIMPNLPHIPGVEGAGTVDAIGNGVEGFSVGDRVAWMGSIGAGGYSTHSVIAQPYVTKLSDEIDFTTAAALPVNAMTAWHMLVNLGQAKAGDTVLIHAAAGGVGTMALQIAKYLGLTVLASVSTDKVGYAQTQGADHVINYKNQDVTKYVMAMTNGRGVDLILNPIAGNTLITDLNALAPLGTVVLFGFLGGQPQGTFQEDLAQHFQQSIAVRISDIYTYFTHRPDAFNADMAKVFELLSNNVLRPQITTLPLDEAAAAHRRLETGETTGKLVLTIN